MGAPLHVKVYPAVLLLLLAAPAPAQTAADSGAPETPPLQSFVPMLPPSVVPPRISAPYPCHWPHALAYEHPVRPTVMTFTVTAQGRVANPKVAQSSGSEPVDAAAVDCVSDWVYAPAMRDGAPVDVTWATEINLTVTTRMSPRAPEPPSNWPTGTAMVMMPVRKFSLGDGDTGCDAWHRDAARGVLVAFDVETDGSVKGATVAGSSGDAAEDKDALDCVARRTYKPGTRGGVPVEIRLTAELYGGG